jgi:hypothetical protein
VTGVLSTTTRSPVQPSPQGYSRRLTAAQSRLSFKAAPAEGAPIIGTGEKNLMSVYRGTHPSIRVVSLRPVARLTSNQVTFYKQISAVISCATA